MAKKKLTGLGDVIKTVTDAIGIEQCDGCVERQNKLNIMIPFEEVQDLPLEQNEIEFLMRVKDNIINSSVDQEYIFQVYNRVTGSSLKQCICPSLIEKLKHDLIKLINKDDK